MLSVLLCFQDYTDGFKDTTAATSVTATPSPPAVANSAAIVPPPVPQKTAGEQILAAQTRSRVRTSYLFH